MKKFMFLFRGGQAQEGTNPQEEMRVWSEWITKLAHDKVFIAGYPFGDEARIVKEDTEEEFHFSEQEVGGYMVVQTETLDMAVEVAKGAPNVGRGGSVEVRLIDESMAM